MRAFLIAVALLLVQAAMPRSAPPDLDRYDVVWTSPSEDAAGSMPIGNGEVVLNVWVEKATGDVLFYIARSDALSEISRVLKLGRIRVHLEPSPFKDAADFQQHLHLRDGNITFESSAGSVLLFVDADAQTIHLSGDLKSPSSVTATAETWRNEPRALPKDEQGSAWSVHDAPFPLVESADRFPTPLTSEIGVLWEHDNETSVVPKLWENQSLTGLPGTSDPLLHRLFGGFMTGTGFGAQGHSIIASQPLRSFDIEVRTFSYIPPAARAQASSPLREALARTRNWWHEFWDRSWVFASGSDAESITRGYVLQRYVQACQGRGTYPIKFNGGYYTVEPKAMGKPYDPDWRAWGDSHWWQNVRHMYHPMLASGDFEMMEPLFRLYESNWQLAESRTRLYHGCEGAYFPETMTVFGTYSGGDYGWNRTGLQPKDVQCPWWQYAWNQGPELVALMLDRWDYTRDERFLKDRVLPMAVSVLKYFDTRFRKDEHGQIILDPTQSVETYWTGVINDMPSTAGLIAVTERLCALPKRLVTDGDRAFFLHMRNACPNLPLQEGPDGPQLAPAQKYDDKRSNVENPELYAIWPFRLVTLNHPDALQAGLRAYARRKEHLDVGWGYDGNAAALLGLTGEAQRIMRVKCANSHAGYRWPATWGPNFDWLPDQNHGGNLLNTADLMLLQADPLEQGGAIRVLPAWPKEWDVDFKLHAPGNTVVHCRTSGGKIAELTVSPASRMKDVVLPDGWEGTR